MYQKSVQSVTNNVTKSPGLCNDFFDISGLSKKL